MIKILIDDYLKDKTDMRLDILCANLNPEFKLSKKNKEHIKLLIEDYAKDQNKSRLKILTEFVGGNNKPVSIKKIKKTLATNKNTIDDEYIQIQQEMDEMNKQILDSKGDKLVLSALAPAYKALENRLETAIRKRDKQMMAQLDPVKIEKEMVAKLFGDVNDTNSHAYKILNGLANDFRIQMPYDPAVMIRKLFFHNGKEPYDYAAGLIDAGSRTWRVTKGQALNVYDQGNRTI